MKDSRYLKHPTSPVDVTPKTVSQLLDAMQGTGFQGRKLAEAYSAWASMLKEDGLTVMMGLTGAMVPAGMRKVVSYLIRERMVDCLVSTGANIFHDIHEAVGGFHYKGHHAVDDSALYGEGIDRIYDVFAVEDEFRRADRFIGEFAKGLDPSLEYSTREFLHLLGKEISKTGKESILTAAWEANVPIFVPALGDSSIGIGLMLARREGHRLNISQLKDVDEITMIVEQSPKTGVVYVGGGVPKNFIQQTEVITSLLGIEKGGHDYAVQFTTDAPHWGGLSGCTFDEAISWGKIAPEAKQVQVFVDATIALPIVAHGLMEKTQGFIKDRKGPHYIWSGDGLELKFKKRVIR